MRFAKSLSTIILSYFPYIEIPDFWTKCDAIFSTGIYPDGQSNIHDLWKRIFSEWFPNSNYENANAPEFEMTYDRGNDMYEMEIGISVVKKPVS
ncbi:GyrI-like domain-containing protein [Paenibacillus sp. NPDC057934]|uniref:GyrI-like domain-containing protein n=1 Tax=Paenibacillus sp. NPDC057934 TaxID=3346282 RepID=UPI0036DED510